MKIKKHFCGQPYEDGQIICTKCGKSIDRTGFSENSGEKKVKTAGIYILITCILLFGSMQLYRAYKKSDSKLIPRYEMKSQIPQDETPRKIKKDPHADFKMENWVLTRDGQIIVYGLVTNNTDEPIKDISVYCRTFAKSGTQLSNPIASDSETFYDIWEPNETKRVTFSIDNIRQTSELRCSVEKSRNIIEKIVMWIVRH